MATTIYKSANIYLVDGTEVYITPLKIKYLRQFMDKFDQLKESQDNTEEANRLLMESAVIAMKQYYPSIKTVKDLEDNLDMPNLYVFLEASAGIKLKPSEEDKQESADDENSWGKLDLAKLEAEVFLLGIWKDYEELVDLDKQSGKEDAWEKMKAKVFSGGQAANSNDILAYQGANAAKAGFGIGMGLSYEKL